MTFVRCFFLTLAFVLLCPSLPRTSPRPATCTPSNRRAQRGSRARQTPQAYQLPPDKLAKAIAISRIRNILDIVGAALGPGRPLAAALNPRRRRP